MAVRRNRKNNGKRERIIMIGSSLFLLTALSMAGVYMQSRNEQVQDDGYTIDFGALEDGANDFVALDPPAATGKDDPGKEAGSGHVTIPGLTDGNVQERPDAQDKPGATTKPDDAKPTDAPKPTASAKPTAIPRPTATAKPTASPKPTATPKPAPTASPKPVQTGANGVTKELHFAESDGLLRPVAGEVLIPYSMNSSVYFTTLDQYKYNPALMLRAEQGADVLACTDGKVIRIFEDARIGTAITLELGDGYEMTYGQLEEIGVEEGEYVDAGAILGKVAAPTKYFSLEGANLYLQLTADGTPLDAEPLFK
jgi:murein DD-endopeptidase MepM/ murein hydrolase activator NlpD